MSGYNIGIGVGLRYIQRGVVDLMAQAIRSSMVVWYDIKRQGATNESMSQNPILKDLSGNGHDATCYNFAWSGMSGIGGYTEDFKNAWYNLETEGTIDMWSHNSFVLTSTAGHSTASIIYTNRDDITLKFKVSGLTEGDIIINQRNPFERVLTITEDGIYEVQLNRCGITSSTQRDSCNIKIELIPEYPNALVADGVDDYAKVEGLPILTDYTVIAKRKWLDDTKRAAIATKLTTSGNTGAFGFEYVGNIGEHFIINFGRYLKRDIFEESDISYQTKTSYNGTSIYAGNLSDSNLLNILSVRPGNGSTKAALYSFILFDRTLTDEEIEWVKKNLLGVETPEQKYSCFGTGQWVMKYPWINDDLWKMEK